MELGYSNRTSPLFEEWVPIEDLLTQESSQLDDHRHPFLFSFGLHKGAALPFLAGLILCRFPFTSSSACVGYSPRVS